MWWFRLLTVALVPFALLSLGHTAWPQKSDSQQQAAKHKDITKVANAYALFVGKKGEIQLPKGYRTRWAHLGSVAVAKNKGKDVISIHDTYTQPEVIATYKRTGKFPDGAVLIKEVRNVSIAKMTTGRVARPAEIDVWFVMIKDAKGRFKKNKHWGDGWGWALYQGKNPRKNVSAGYAQSCLGCHSPAEDTDWVYINDYPPLRKKKLK